MRMGKKGMRCGAEALVEALERAGTEVVFGYPGANIVDCWLRLMFWMRRARRSRLTVRW